MILTQNGICLWQLYSRVLMEFHGLRLCGAYFYLFDLEYFKQSWQLSIKCFNCSFIPSQYRVSFSFILHLLRPRQPSCISFRASSLFLSGIMIRVPFSTNPSSIVSSSWKVQYFCTSGGTSLMVLGHPHWMMCLRITSLSSSCVAIHRLCRLLLLALSWLVIWLTCSFGNEMETF